MVPHHEGPVDGFRLRYSPDLKEIFVVEQDASLTPVKLLHNGFQEPRRHQYMRCLPAHC